MTQGIKGERGGEAEEHEEHEEHTKIHAHQPDTPDTYPRDSVDHANRISKEEARGRIPGERLVLERRGLVRERECLALESHLAIHKSTTRVP